MLKLKSGRVIFFESISSVFTDSNGSLIVELPSKEQLEFGNLTMEQFIERRNNYFAEIAIRGEVTEEFGTKIVHQLKEELATAIATLQTATIAYETSASLANTASTALKVSSESIVATADNVFTDVTKQTKKSATKFGNDIDTIYRDKIKSVVSKLQEQVGKLESEIAFIEE